LHLDLHLHTTCSDGALAPGIHETALEAGAGPAAAEPGGLRISDLRISVWPEYDEPRVLVVNTGTFSGNTFPKEVSFYLPKGVEVTEVCGLKKPQDEHLCQLFETRPEGDSVVMTYNLPVPDFYFEYYYNPIQGTGDREVLFSYKSAYPMDDLQVDVQQPLRSTAFTLSPSTSQVTSDSQGFKYYQYSFSNVAPQKPVDLKVAYQKSDDRPSVAKQKPGSTSAGGAQDRTGLIALAIGGAGALGFFGYLAVRRRPEAVQVTSRRAAATVAASRHAAPAIRQAAPARPRAGGTAAAFCTNCGSALAVAEMKL